MLLELGMPVALVYLGFLGCDDMAKNSVVIATEAERERLVKVHSASIALHEISGQAWRVLGRAFVPLIRSLSVVLQPAS